MKTKTEILNKIQEHKETINKFPNFDICEILEIEINTLEWVLK